jgi:hypothetical protein
MLTLTSRGETGRDKEGKIKGREKGNRGSPEEIFELQPSLNYRKRHA